MCLLLSSCALPRSTRPIVKIGLVAPFEGRYRALGYEALYAVKWVVRQRNMAGGVAGYMVELVALDDGDDPVSSAFQAREFGVDVDVMGVVGPFSEAAIAAAAPVYGELGLAMVTPATCGPTVRSPRQGTGRGDGAAFCLGAGADALAQALLDRLPPGAQVTLLEAPFAAGALGECLRPAAQQRVGVWECGRPALSVAEGVGEGALARALKTSSPSDLYLYDGDVLAAAAALVEMRDNGIDAPLWGGPALARTQLPQIAGEAAAGACYAITAPLLADLAPESAFVAGYRELASTPPGPWAALAYDATMLLLDALERSIQADGKPSRQGTIAQLSDVRGPDGEPVFVQGRRRQAETIFYCYGPGDGYPGRKSD